MVGVEHNRPIQESFDVSNTLKEGPHGNNIHEGFHITEREKEVLRLMAQGLSNKDIGESLGISNDIVRGRKNEIFEMFGIHVSAGVVIMAATEGILNPEDLTKNLDILTLNKLNKAELEVLGVMAESRGKITSKKDLAKSLFVSKSSISYRAGNIRKKLGLNSLIEAVLLYMVSKNRRDTLLEKQARELTPRQLIILALFNRGMKTSDIAKFLALSESHIRSDKKRIFEMFRVDDIDKAIVRARELGVLESKDSQSPQNNPV